MSAVPSAGVRCAFFLITGVGATFRGTLTGELYVGGIRYCYSAGTECVDGGTCVLNNVCVGSVNGLGVR